MSEDNQVEHEALLISAFLDGELTAEQQGQFERLMETQKAFRDKVAQRQQQHNLITQAYSQIDDVPMPEGVMAMLEQKADVVSLPRKTSTFPPFAMAASLLLVGGLTLFYFAQDDELTVNGHIALVNATLDSALSGSVISLQDDKNSQLLVNLSFLDGQNRYCREYFLAQGQSPAVHRVSCKGQRGWQTEVEVQSERVLGNDNFRPASGSAASLVENYLDSHMQSDPFDLQQERQAMAKAWSHDQG